MELSDAIRNRRSIRSFLPDDIPDDILRRVLELALQTPSGKNRQPWKLYVVQNNGKHEMMAVLRKGLSGKKGGLAAGAAHSFGIMEQAPVTIFVFNSNGANPLTWRSGMQRFGDIVDLQSVGGFIQTLLLAAEGEGLGSLWICDVFSAYRDICTWLGEKSLLVAAVSLGYKGETPKPRPRKTLDEVVTWL